MTAGSGGNHQSTVVTTAGRAFLFFFLLSAAVPTRLPERVSDDAFRQMISDFSEPEGTSFGGPDNFVSNEALYQVVLPALQKKVSAGGVYLGVGPEQNFSYIAALRPGLAFIIDIRRQNMLEHLMYKVLFEVSSNRADFLSRLFSRPAAQVRASSSAAELFQAYERVAPDQKVYEENLDMIKSRLRTHGFQLNAEDAGKIDHIYRAFFTFGPRLNFVGLTELPPDVDFPNFGQLMLQTDGKGKNWSFLASEERFRFCKDLHERNLVVPVVGDFAGPKTIRAIGQYVRDRGGAVTTIYASNVEEYLFEQQDNWKQYYSSLSTLPLASSAEIIRSVSVTNSGVGHAGPGFRTIMVTDYIANLLRAFNAGKVSQYRDILKKLSN